MSADTDTLPRPTGGNRCPGCPEMKGPSDLLCVGCWRLMPRVLVSLYRLVWQLVHAGLVEPSARAELERLLLREAREAREARQGTPRTAGHPVTTLRPTLAPPVPALRPSRNARAEHITPTRPVTAPSTPSAAPTTGRTRALSAVGTAILAALPDSEATAISATELTTRTQLTASQVASWFSDARQRGVPTLGVCRVGGGEKRGRYTYWRRTP